MTLHGIDVSSWQAGIDLSAVPGDFAIIKATGGTGYVNPACDGQYQSAKVAGKRIGLYHFAHETGCPGAAITEADHFVDSIQGYLNGDVLLVLDYESDNQTDSGWALTWLNRVFQRTGVRPLIYLNSAAISGGDWSAVQAADYGLWLAWYAVSTPTQGYSYYDGRNVDDVPIPLSWGSLGVAMWQFTSTARLAGWNGALDANVFYGDGAAWDAYCRPSGEPAPVQVESAPAAPAPAPAPAPVSGGQCTVSPGDSLSAIAAQVGVNWQDIAALNGISAPYVIQPGQVLNLPEGANLAALGSAPAPAPAAPSGLPPYCTVDPGDTLGGIANQYGVSVQYILDRNPDITNPDYIQAGQRINLQ